MNDRLDASQQEKPSPLGWIVWPGLIVAMLVGQTLFVLVMVYMATSDRSFAVEPDYYQKSLNWNEQAAQQRENARLGWSVEIDLGDSVDVLKQRTVTCVLTDAAGAPVEGAAVDVVAFHHVRGAERSAATLIDAGDGRYEATLRFTRRGLWEFRLAIRRGSEQFTHVLTRDVYPPGESRPWRSS